MKVKLLIAALLLVSVGAKAEISNVICDTEKNKLVFHHDQMYNHAWVYVNAKMVADFWTVSSGSDEVIVDLNSGDHVSIYRFNKIEGYGSTWTLECL